MTPLRNTNLAVFWLYSYFVFYLSAIFYTFTRIPESKIAVGHIIDDYTAGSNHAPLSYVYTGITDVPTKRPDLIEPYDLNTVSVFQREDLWKYVHRRHLNGQYHEKAQDDH